MVNEQGDFTASDAEDGDTPGIARVAVCAPGCSDLCVGTGYFASLYRLPISSQFSVFHHASR